MDYDNLVFSLKAARDTTCDWLLPGMAAGRADGDPRIEVVYKQQQAKKYSLQIEIKETRSTTLG